MARTPQAGRLMRSAIRTQQPQTVVQLHFTSPPHPRSALNAAGRFYRCSLPAGTRRVRWLINPATWIAVRAPQSSVTGPSTRFEFVASAWYQPPDRPCPRKAPECAADHIHCGQIYVVCRLWRFWDVEDAMSVPNWNELRRYLVDWHQRAHSRHELMMLSDRELSDVGLTSTDVHSEMRKSLWQ
jgi:uncharacterized protein YjiS (DUF1127 family)